MFNPEFIYKFLTVPQLDKIQQELDQFYDSHKDNHVFNKKNAHGATIVELSQSAGEIPNSLGRWMGFTFVHADIESTMRQLPTLQSYFNSMAVGPIERIALVNTHPHSIQAPHVDQGVQYLALNFPLHGCNDTHTLFFKQKGELTTVISMDEVRPGVKEQRKFLRYMEENPEEIGRYILTAPVLLNIKLPHSVVNNGDSQRVGISFRFKTDPWALTI